MLRGFALLGILVLNIESFSGPASMHDIPVGVAKPAFVGWHATLDVCILSVKWLFFEGKMLTLFAILYGAGIVLLTQRFESKGQAGRAADIFHRRNMWLLLFGLLHGTLIWSGDVLSQYALVALLVMFPLRHVAAKRLIVAGVAIGIIGGTFGLTQVTHLADVLAANRLRHDAVAALAAHRSPTPAQAAALAADAAARAAEPTEIRRAVEAGRRPYFESIAPRTTQYLDLVVQLFRTGFILQIVGSMMLGMGLFKSGFLTGASSKSTYVKTALAGYAITAPVVLIGVTMAHAKDFAVPAVMVWMVAPYVLQIFAGALANIALLLLLSRSGWIEAARGALANVGRTAFSSYILTSLVCQCLFAWGPWKLYGDIEYYQQLYFVVAIWVANLIASALWLRYFHYGPLEWVWRSLAYWQRQPLRRDLLRPHDFG